MIPLDSKFARRLRGRIAGAHLAEIIDPETALDWCLGWLERHLIFKSKDHLECEAAARFAIRALAKMLAERELECQNSS